MADRVMTWNLAKDQGNARFGPAFYAEQDFNKSAVRIQAEDAPDSADAEFDILADGVSIFADRSSQTRKSTSTKGATITSGTAKTTAVLTKGENSEDFAGDFNDDAIENGAWVTCEQVAGGGGRNYTVQLELDQVCGGDAPEE